MTIEALRVVRPGGAFHIIDAILPVSRRAFAKEMFFRMDRGRFPRYLDELTNVRGRAAPMSYIDASSTVRCTTWLICGSCRAAPGRLEQERSDAAGV